MRIPVRTSRMATWSRRFGSFAIPLLVISVFMHRAETLSSETFLLVGSVALGIAVLAIILALGAFVRLWQTGDEGWGRAAIGLLLGLICLLPLGAAAYEYRRFPETSDISTNPARPLVLVRAATGATLDQAEIIAAFPNVVARDYRISANETFKLIENLIADRGWEIIRRQPPQLEIAVGQINALETTWLGWRDEVAVRVSGDFLDARVEMRSTSTYGTHDLGRNGKRIEEFLLALDSAVVAAERNRPAPDAPPVPATHGENQ